MGKQSLEGVKAIVYRAIENTCKASAYGVGLPVQMAVVTEAGIEELNEGDDDHTGLSDFVDLWKSKEVETLGALKPSPQPLPVPVEIEPSIDESEIAEPAVEDAEPS